VSNAYDADATSVYIDLDLKNKELSIKDTGNGISTSNFDKYLRIAGQTIEGSEFTIKFQRKRIGRFGIGFLAAFPFCNKIEITSKRQGESLGFVALIPAKRYVKGTKIEEDISDIPVDGYNEPQLGSIDDHFTIIKLIGLNDLALNYFQTHEERSRQITIESWDGVERLIWQLQETLPLDFQYNSSPLASALEHAPVSMDIFFNGKKLYRNDNESELVASSSGTCIALGELQFKFAIVTNWKIIHPVEARGLKMTFSPTQASGYHNNLS